MSNYYKIYLIGVVFTLTWNLFWAIFRFVSKRSILDKNMALLGLRRSMLTGKYRIGGKLWIELLILAIFIILSSLASWIGFLFEAGNFMFTFYKNMEEPEELKKIKWRMKNFLLNPSEMVEIDIKTVEIQRGKKFSSDELNKIVKAYEKKGLSLNLEALLHKTNPIVNS